MLRTGLITIRRFCRTSRYAQIGIIMIFWLTGEAAVRTAKLPIPGGIFGLFVLLFLLAAKILSPHTVRLGARWFLREMLLFFVPAVLVVLDHPEFMGLLGLKIVGVIILGTFIVMIVTAEFVELSYVYLTRKDRRSL